MKDSYFCDRFLLKYMSFRKTDFNKSADLDKAKAEKKVASQTMSHYITFLSFITAGNIMSKLRWEGGESEIVNIYE